MLDDTSKFYLTKIASLREKQRKLLPLFLQSQKVVNRHQKCLKVMLDDNNENIPYQLSRIVEKGQEGLEGYSKLLKNIKSVLTKNESMVSSLSEYSSKIKQLQQKNEQLTMGMKQISGDVSS